MIIFNSKRIFEVLISAVVFTTVTGCLSPHQQDKDKDAANEPAATFYAEKSSGTSTISDVVKDWGLPYSQLYNFTVCLKDRLTQDSIRGHKFIVSDGTIEQNLRTDSSGCFNWNEKIGYDFFADPK